MEPVLLRGRVSISHIHLLRSRFSSKYHHCGSVQFDDRARRRQLLRRRFGHSNDLARRERDGERRRQGAPPVSFSFFFLFLFFLENYRLNPQHSIPATVQ